MTLAEVIRQRIRASGPLPFATYAEIALYHSTLGYYSRAEQRSGRGGDFFTSVDLGPIFGEMLAVQFAEMWRHLGTKRFDLVEAAAGNGRLILDVLTAAEKQDPSFYAAIDVYLVERSPTARAAQLDTIGAYKQKLMSSDSQLPSHINGVIFANELLDALPPHVLVMTTEGLREMYVDTGDSGNFVERFGPLSSERVKKHVDERGIVLEPGWRAEIVPDAFDWVRQAGQALHRGFLLLIDYGYEAQELYSSVHMAGTIGTYNRHLVDTHTGSNQPWLVEPGSRDITSHVDLTGVRETAESVGILTLGILDQTYFLLGLGIGNLSTNECGLNDLSSIKRRLAIKSLLIPGGLGSTQKVMIFGKKVGVPSLKGLSYLVRAT